MNIKSFSRVSAEKAKILIVFKKFNNLQYFLQNFTLVFVSVCMGQSKRSNLHVYLPS